MTAAPAETPASSATVTATVAGAAVPAAAPAVTLPPALLAKLAEPGVAESLTSLLSHADLVAILLEGLDGLIGRSEVIGDSLLSGIPELLATAKESPAGQLDVQGLLTSAQTLAGALPQAAPALAEVAGSGVTDDLALISRAVVKGREQFATDPVAVPSVFTLMRLFKDPDIGRAISYLATVAKALGQELPH